ncbi:MAG: hypothetical protein HW390_3380 [Candidatus Brocadiaceae bacterium]|nr:hypothetical protein [Candidatus Brocadiaceae bacterium]
MQRNQAEMKKVHLAQSEGETQLFSNATICEICGFGSFFI